MMDFLTPRASYQHNPFDAHPLLTPTRVTATSPFFDPNLNSNNDLTPSSPATPSFAASVPTTSLSLHAPDFNIKMPPSPRRPEPTSTSRGQIHVKLIQARGLNVRATSARPYVVVQFEQNEFVSRDPTDETDREVKGMPTRNSSSSALSALGAIESKLAPLDVSRKSKSGSNNTSPASSVGSNKSSNGGGLFGRLSAHNPVWKHEVSFDVTNADSLVTFNVYDRSVSDHGFLGTLQIKPVLVHEQTVDQWYKLRPYENESQIVSGEIRVQITFEQLKSKRALTPRDFEFLKLIGRGTFGKVFQVRKKDTKRIYAMKVLSKKEIVAKKEVAHTIGERKILQRSLECPFLVGLKFSFQTDSDLYLVTDFKSGGELFWHLQRETRFSEERARFYIAELVLALEHLHKYDIVYRDLKPENILLDATGHVALCDFGLSKADLKPDELTTTFCGTTEYLAPEILLDEHGYSKIVDFWSLGVLLFEMCCGWSPFYAEETQQMYKNICFGKIRFPKGVIGEDGKQFVKGLLNRNPKHRLGAQRDAAELKEHPFFKSIDWDLLSQKKVTPPFKPVVESDESTANFDPEFTSADIREVGLNESDILNEEDPSADWVSQSVGGSGFVHTPNGPLGSEKTPPPTPLSGFTSMSINGHANGSSNGVNGKSSSGANLARNESAAARSAKGVAINGKTKKEPNAPGSTPLTNSVQENFRGFTYHGESVQQHADAFTARFKDRHVTDEEEDPHEVTTEDEFEDFGKSAGRYANARRKGLGFTEMDD
ncbi:Serine/threonine-protein kinase [Stygiomarasmius scandens]|uniref:Serine/threonine-protein kinase n=1 Tax=Marasmiellus scandens TaxID=2682957 RepID=A0ABR1K1K9_9AGAR